MQDTYKHKGLRKALVETLIKKGIKDNQVIRAIETLPRHFFIPLEFENHAYEDKAFPIGDDQTISQPYTVAYQTQLLEIKEGDKVLEIGTGSGYQASILYLCKAKVFSVERIDKLSKKAQVLLQKLDIKVQFLIADGTKGWVENSPYDKIIVTAGAPNVSKDLTNQLKNGGMIVIPVGSSMGKQKMVRMTKLNENEFKTEVYEDFSFVPLLGEKGW